MNWLNGKKTYITAIVGIATTAVAAWNGQESWLTAFEHIFTLASVAFTRHGIATSSK